MQVAEDNLEIFVEFLLVDGLHLKKKPHNINLNNSWKV